MKDWLTLIVWLAILAGVVILGRRAISASIQASFAFVWALSGTWLRGGIIVIAAAAIFWLVVGALEFLGPL
jgi:hypothetical protein